MSGFSDDWLALREPADHAARDTGLLQRVLGELSERQAQALRVVDLGSGSGSNLRYLLPRLPAAQRWRLIDNDARLLAAMPERIARWAETRGVALATSGDGRWSLVGGEGEARFEPVALDLACGFEPAIPADTDLVTASALLDLFSPESLDALASACASARAAVLFALSYDGRIDWRPALDDDVFATDLLNAHQRRDKGLGGAAGPDAHAFCADALARQGYDVATARADWRLDGAHAPLQRELLNGWSEALLEQAPGERDRLESWCAERRALIDSGDSTLHVGHVDLAALPPKRSQAGRGS